MGSLFLLESSSQQLLNKERPRTQIKQKSKSFWKPKRKNMFDFRKQVEEETLMFADDKARKKLKRKHHLQFCCPFVNILTGKPCTVKFFSYKYPPALTHLTTCPHGKGQTEVFDAYLKEKKIDLSSFKLWLWRFQPLDKVDSFNSHSVVIVCKIEFGGIVPFVCTYKKSLENLLWNKNFLPMSGFCIVAFITIFLWKNWEIPL